LKDKDNAHPKLKNKKIKIIELLLHGSIITITITITRRIITIIIMSA
jgi:hypothetical protein